MTHNYNCQRPTTMTITPSDLSKEELGTTLEERLIAEEYKIWKKNTPCELLNLMYFVTKLCRRWGGAE